MAKNSKKQASAAKKSPAPKSSGNDKKEYDLSDVGQLYKLVRNEDEDFIKENVGSYLCEITKRYKLENYTPLILFDDNDSISHYHSNKIYEAASGSKNDNIYLILNSPGGKIEPAYLISKTCKKLAKEKFSVAIPRRAKSAATLIALGADHIHMGLMSELGPIDPQIGGYPALGLANALKKVAELSAKYPDSADMFAQYLSKNLNLKDLGYFDRVSESASQYAERLLSGKKFPKPHDPKTLSNHFVNHYKDHSFVIDMEEACSLLGADVILSDTPEYYCANEIYSFLDTFGIFLDVLRKQDFWIVGGLSDGISFRNHSKTMD